MRRLRYLKPLVFLVIITLFSVVVMLLWNGIMPNIFGLTTISFWQALGFFVLCRLLFGRISPGGFRTHEVQKHRKMNKMRKKWRKMTPEQRKEFIHKREQWRKGNHPFFSEDFPFEEPEDFTSEKPDNDDK
ncbi:MAG TPA: hypothetical protein VK084_05440 [Chitinophagaceae bacterium]|nr:hypothetical protein [Chitinophagaceae bacterium]